MSNPAVLMLKELLRSVEAGEVTIVDCSLSSETEETTTEMDGGPVDTSVKLTGKVDWWFTTQPGGEKPKFRQPLSHQSYLDTGNGFGAWFPSADDGFNEAAKEIADEAALGTAKLHFEATWMEDAYWRSPSPRIFRRSTQYRIDYAEWLIRYWGTHKPSKGVIVPRFTSALRDLDDAICEATEHKTIRDVQRTKGRLQQVMDEAIK